MLVPHTLLLRIRGPMQSWGTSSRFSIRDTGKEPSKSGVIGLLCAAVGISRDDANSGNQEFRMLTELKMGVRVLREGVMQKDYHTALDVIKADGTAPKRPKDPKFTSLSTRWYLSDADFVVALEGEWPLLQSIQQALQNPKWQLFLGRKSFLASLPVHFTEGVFEGEFESILRDETPVGDADSLSSLLANYNVRLGIECAPDGDQRLIIEDDGGTEVRQDVPLDFAERKFANRRVRTDFLIPRGRHDEPNLSDKNDIEPAMSAGAA